MTLPGALMVAMAMLVGLAMLETGRKKAARWKGSSLALLFHDDDDKLGQMKEVRSSERGDDAGSPLLW